MTRGAAPWPGSKNRRALHANGGLALHGKKRERKNDAGPKTHFGDDAGDRRGSFFRRVWNKTRSLIPRVGSRIKTGFFPCLILTAGIGVGGCIRGGKSGGVGEKPVVARVGGSVTDTAASTFSRIPGNIGNGETLRNQPHGDIDAPGSPAYGLPVPMHEGLQFQTALETGHGLPGGDNRITSGPAPCVEARGILGMERGGLVERLGIFFAGFFSFWVVNGSRKGGR